MVAIQQRRGVQNPFRRGGPRGNLPTHFGGGGYKSAHAASNPLWRLGKIAAVLMAGGMALYALSGESSSSQPPGGKLRDIEAASKNYDSENSRGRNQAQHRTAGEKDHLLAAKKELEQNGEHHIHMQNDGKARMAPDKNKHENLVQPEHGNSHAIKADTKSQLNHEVKKPENVQSRSRSDGENNKEHAAEHDEGTSNTKNLDDNIKSGKTYHSGENEKGTGRPKDRDPEEETLGDDTGAAKTKQNDGKMEEENKKSKLPDAKSKTEDNNGTDKKEHERSTNSVLDTRKSGDIGDKASEAKSFAPADSTAVETLPALTVPPASKSNHTQITGANSTTTNAIPESQVASNASFLLPSNASSVQPAVTTNAIGSYVATAANSSISYKSESEIAASTNSSSTTQSNTTVEQVKKRTDGSSDKTDGEDTALEVVAEGDKGDKAIEVVDAEDKAVEVMDKDGKIVEIVPDDHDNQKDQKEKDSQVEAADENFQPLEKRGKTITDDKGKAESTVPPTKTEQEKKAEGWKQAEMQNLQPLQSDGEKH